MMSWVTIATEIISGIDSRSPLASLCRKAFAGFSCAFGWPQAHGHSGQALLFAAEAVFGRDDE